MSDRDEWSMRKYAPDDALLVGTWALGSGNSLSVRARLHAGGFGKQVP